jgi:diadenosine tetraphosphate (Ap4A) HIT family hydrolase
VRRIDKDEALARVAREAEHLPPRFGGCLMCGVAAGHGAEIEVLAEREGAVAVLDRYASRRGHVLVVLRRHAESITELGWEEYQGIQRLAWEAAQAVSRALRPKRVFIAALGSAERLPMSFPHQHVHVIPLFEGGEGDRPAEVFSWRRGVVVYEPEEARELATSLRAVWEGASGGGR